MITKITGEQPFQVLTNNFSISPSAEGYTLQISADGVNYSNLFTVSANTTRLVTGVAANSYYRLLGNNSQVSINWMKTCVTEGQGGGGNAGELEPVSEFPTGVPEGTVVALASGDTVGVYQYNDGEWIPVAGGDMSNYYTKAQTDAAITAATEDLATEEYVDAAISGISLDGYWTSGETKDYVDEAISGLTDMIETKEEVIASALTELNETFDDYYTMDEVDEVIEEALSGISFDGYWTSGETKSYVDSAASAITSQVEDVERVTATALTELHDAILDLSGATEDFATEQYVDDAIEAAMTGSTPNLDPAFPRMPWFTLDNGDQVLDYVKSAIFDTYVPDGAEEPVNCTQIWLMDTAFDLLDNNVYWEVGQVNFTIDPEEKVAYVENIPAGNYVFGLSKSQAGDNYDHPEFEINYWSKDSMGWAQYTVEDGTSEIWENSDFDIDQYWKDRFESYVALTNNGEWYNWSFPKDVSRFEIRIVDDGEGNESLEINTTYKDYEAKEEVIAAALVDLNEKKVESQDVKHIVKLTQAEYDLIANPDPETLYIIINNQ